MKASSTFLAALLFGVFACGSPATSKNENTTGGNDDDVVASKELTDRATIRGSKETMDELGVESWGVAIDSEGALIIRGYDADKHARVEAHQSIAINDAEDHRSVQFGVRTESGQEADYEVTIEGRLPESDEDETDITIEMRSNTFVSSLAAQKIAERLVADEATSGIGEIDDSIEQPEEENASSSSGGGVSLRPGSIHVQGRATGKPLRKDSCWDLTPGCIVQGVKTAVDLIKTVKPCALTGKTVLTVGRCGLRGARIGRLLGAQGAMGGFFIGAAACIIKEGPMKIAKNAYDCGSGIADTIESYKGAKDECRKKTSSCKSEGSSSSSTSSSSSSSSSGSTPPPTSDDIPMANQF